MNMDKKLIASVGVLLILFQSFGQTTSKIAIDFSSYGVKMLYDKAAPDNSQFFWLNKYLPMGIGAEVSTYYHNHSGFSPQLDLSFTGFSYNYYSFRNDSWRKNNTLNIFLGPSYHFTNNLSLSYTVGISIMSSQECFGMKPEIKYSFGKNNKVKIKLSFTNIFPKYDGEVEPFGYLGLGIGYRLF